jgi:hypothetical protein
MAILKFQTNVPIEVRLRSIEGKPVESQFGGMQHMFSAEEGAFYVSEVVGQILAEQIKALEVRVGEPIEITKAEVSKGGGRKGIQWTVARTVAPEAPSAPSELEQRLAESIRLVEARKQAKSSPEAAEAPAWAEYLVIQSQHLVDAYAQVLKHSARHEGLVKGDDVRSLFLSAFINVSKSNGGRNAA